MSEINEQQELYPTMDEIEGLEEAFLDKEEESLEKEEDQDDSVEGIGELGRTRRWGRRKKRRSRRRSNRRRAADVLTMQGLKVLPLKQV